jgi:aspartate/methionine/tyrosine aminotransferase
MSFLCNGSSEKPAGFMVPIPQYPLYTATISEFNSEKVVYKFIKRFKNLFH